MLADLAQLADDADDDFRQRPVERPGDEEQYSDDHRSPQPADAVERGRDIEIALENAADDKADDERRTRPGEPLHDPADHAKDHDRVEIAPIVRALIGRNE